MSRTTDYIIEQAEAEGMLADAWLEKQEKQRREDEEWLFWSAVESGTNFEREPDYETGEL